jgi:SAM-dependent methyltransferase
MTTDPEFRTDLYRGAAPYYDRYRPPYPETLFDDLLARLPVSGSGRLLDLACGTGQVAFPLSPHFVEVVAVDQEPDAVQFGRTKAKAAGADNIRWLTGSAETVALDGSFELITVGNAFHRLKRRIVAERMRSWAGPGGGVAIVWGDTPSQGDLPWQKALEDLIVEWMARAGTTDRVPAGWASAMASDPHEAVLRRAGFEYLGKFGFTADQTWTVETLIGFMYSTSMLNRSALGDESEEFERRLAERLGPYSSDGTFRVPATYAYELARWPGSA